MNEMKINRQYHFSVEGETEQWYLEWLQKQINSKADDCTVSLKAEIAKNPIKYIKRHTIINKTIIYHLSDYESDEPQHVARFNETMDNLKKARKAKKVDYMFCYSNLTFDLWIVLHKQTCNGAIAHRKNYLELINRAYDENFENMDKYKKEDNFKGILGKLTLDNVIDAIDRAKIIMRLNQENGYVLHKYKGCEYYKENPSLMVHNAIEKILEECNLI